MTLTRDTAATVALLLTYLIAYSLPWAYCTRLSSLASHHTLILSHHNLLAMARARSPYVRKANSVQQRERSRSPRRRSSRSPERRRRSYSRSRSRSRDNYRRSDRRSRSPGGREGGRDSGRYERGFNSSSAAPARGSEDRVQAKEQMMAGVRDASQQDRRVYVGNLSYDVKWHHLKDFMRQGEFEVFESFTGRTNQMCSAGEVVFADVLLLPNGMSKVGLLV